MLDAVTLLIVDDNPVTMAILTSLLRPFCTDIATAKDGEEGLAVFRQVRPHIVLSDIQMPKLDGLSMIERIKTLDSNVKTAVFTNFDNKKVLYRAIEIGVDHFFPKPIDRNHLLSTLHTMCETIAHHRDIKYRLHRQERLLHCVNAVAQRFLQEPHWNEALSSEMETLRDTADAEFIAIYRHHPDDPYRSVAHFDTRNKSIPSTFHYRHRRLMRWYRHLQTKQAIYETVESSERSKRRFVALTGSKSLLMLPIEVNHRLWGVLTVGFAHTQPIAPNDIEIFTTVASIIGSAVNNQQNLQALQLSSMIFEHTMDGVLVTDANNRIIHVNDAFCRITGYRRQEVLGKDPKLLKSGRHDVHFYRSMWQEIAQKGIWQGEIINRKKNGEIYIEWLSINAIRDKQGTIIKHLGIFSDVTQHRQKEQHYIHMATHDPLTGLSNRLVLNDRLEHAVDYAKRNATCFAVVFCDLDGFKPINDTYGHDIGDVILQHCAKRLCRCVRKEDTVCRYGGDEFVILLESVKQIEPLQTVLQRIFDELTQPFVIEDRHYYVGCSIGCAVYPFDAQQPHTLLKRADEAMYTVKQSSQSGGIAFTRNDIENYCHIDYTI